MDDETHGCVVCHSTQLSHQSGLCPEHTYDDDQDRIVNAVAFHLENTEWTDITEKVEHERLLVDLSRTRAQTQMTAALVIEGYQVARAAWLVSSFLDVITEDHDPEHVRLRCAAIWRRASDTPAEISRVVSDQLTAHYAIIEGPRT